MGGEWSALRWQLPAAAGPAGLSAPLGAQPPDAARGRGLADLRRCHVSAAAGAASGFHLGDAELWPELRRQQGPETALLLAGEARAGRGPGLGRESGAQRVRAATKPQGGLSRDAREAGPPPRATHGA